jgi:hypothetical protein
MTVDQQTEYVGDTTNNGEQKKRPDECPIAVDTTTPPIAKSASTFAASTVERILTLI